MEKIMEKFGLKVNEAGIWFKIIFWGSLITTPLVVIGYTVKTFNGVYSTPQGLWYITTSIIGLWCLWLIAKQQKIGWYVLLIAAVFAAVINTVINPNHCWVFLTTGISVYLYYLSLKHKGFWQKLC